MASHFVRSIRARLGLRKTDLLERIEQLEAQLARLENRMVENAENTHG